MTISAIHALPRHLDLTPDHGSHSHAARVDRLFRAILADPSASDPARRLRSARTLARRQIPIASKAIEDEALQRVEFWSRTFPAEQAACAAEVVRDVDWVHAMTDEKGRETVLRGSLDLAFRTEDQGWTLVVFAHEEAGADRERARLLGSVLAAASRGIEPVDSAWLLFRTGMEPELVADRDLRGDAAALRLRALLSVASV